MTLFWGYFEGPEGSPGRGWGAYSGLLDPNALNPTLEGPPGGESDPLWRRASTFKHNMTIVEYNQCPHYSSMARQWHETTYYMSRARETLER